MISYRTDRDRQVQGNRVLSRGEMFDELAVPVADFHDRFARVHADLGKLLVQHDEPGAVVEEPSDAENRAARLYNWAYHQLATFVAPDDQMLSDERVTAARERLFPLAVSSLLWPSLLHASSQLLVDGLNHLVGALRRESVVRYPETFVTELNAAREALALALAALETDDETPHDPDHATLREQWDAHYLALRDVTTGFLRVDGRLAEVDAYFGPDVEPEPPEQTPEVADAADSSDG